MRADARRNREKLLAAAVERFAACGPDASLEAIAQHAGVGIGTLYRHFPTREALIEAAYRDEVDRLCDAARELVDTLPPDEALEEWMERFVGYARTKRGMAGALQSLAASDDTFFCDARQSIIGAFQMLLDAARQAGTIRSDVEAEDVFRAMGGIWLMPDEPEWPARARRLLGLLMDGLRHTG